MDNIYKQESDPRYRNTGWRFAVFPAKGLKDDKFTARKHTRPVGRPHASGRVEFYTPDTDVGHDNSIWLVTESCHNAQHDVS